MHVRADTFATLQEQEAVELDDKIETPKSIDSERDFEDCQPGLDTFSDHGCNLYSAIDCEGSCEQQQYITSSGKGFDLHFN